MARLADIVARVCPLPLYCVITLPSMVALLSLSPLASGTACGATCRGRLGARSSWYLRWHIRVLPVRSGEGAGRAEDQLRQPRAGHHLALDRLPRGVGPTGGVR